MQPKTDAIVDNVMSRGKKALVWIGGTIGVLVLAWFGANWYTARELERVLAEAKSLGIPVPSATVPLASTEGVLGSDSDKEDPGEDRRRNLSLTLHRARKEFLNGNTQAALAGLRPVDGFLDDIAQTTGTRPIPDQDADLPYAAETDTIRNLFALRAEVRSAAKDDQGMLRDLTALRTLVATPHVETAERAQFGAHVFAYHHPRLLARILQQRVRAGQSIEGLLSHEAFAPISLNWKESVRSEMADSLDIWFTWVEPPLPMAPYMNSIRAKEVGKWIAFIKEVPDYATNVEASIAWMEKRHPITQEIDDEGNLVSSLVPLAVVANAHTDGLALQELLRAYAAVLVFRQKNGKLPDSLDEAGIEIQDPWTKEPLQYAVSTSGFKVWSAGQDRRNDGGAHLPRPNEENPADLVFIFPFPERKSSS